MHFRTCLKAQRAFHNDTIAYAQKIFKKIVAMIIYLWFTEKNEVIATVKAKTNKKKNAKKENKKHKKKKKEPEYKNILDDN